MSSRATQAAEQATEGVGAHVDAVGVRVLFAATQKVDALKQHSLVAQQRGHQFPQVTFAGLPDAGRLPEGKHELVAVAALKLLAGNEAG